MRALTERPACFEIEPRGVRSSAPVGYGCRTQLITAYNCGTISSSRCQTTCIAQSTRSTQYKFKCMDELVAAAFGVADRPSLRAKTFHFKAWWSQTGSNRRPPACKAGALPAELWPRLERFAPCKSGGPGKTRTSDLTLIKRAL